MKKFIFALTVTLISLAGNAHAYIVDGLVNDWGVSLTAAGAQYRNYLDTHLPSSPTADHVTEDNVDYRDGTVFVGPGWSVHNIYDAEALYMDNDLSNLYLALITGLPKSEVTYPSGDLFIDTGKYQDPTSPFYNPKKYQYGIDIATSKLYSVDSWQDVVHFADANPWRIGASKTFIADVPFFYSGEQNTHYVLEAGVPLNLLGLKDKDAVYLHWTMKCGNDTLNLHGDVNAVPEPATMALFGTGLAGMLLRRRKVNGV